MDFSNFMLALYDFVGDRYNNQGYFFKDVISNSVNVDAHDFINDTRDGTISRYLSGKASFRAQAQKVLSNMDKDNFITFLSTLFKNDDQIQLFNNALNKKGLKINEFIDVNDIADCFYNILVSIPKKDKVKKNKTKKHIKDKIDLTQSSLATEALNSSPEDYKKLLKKVEDQFKLSDMALNSKLPKNIGVDFEYKTLRNNFSFSPELLAKNKDAFIKHKLSLKFWFDDDKESKRFIRTIQKAGILRRIVEVQPKYVERYIDDFKDEYYDDSRYKHFIDLTDSEIPFLHMKLELNNGYFSLTIDDIILKEEKIVGDIATYSNINENNWFIIKVFIDYSKYVDGFVDRGIMFGLNHEYMKNIDYYKEAYKLYLLLNDNNTHIKLMHIKTNEYFFNTKITNKQNYTKAEYNEMLDLFRKYDKISEIQKITNTIFTFDENEFQKNKPTYDIAYACVKGINTVFDVNMNVVVLVPDDKKSDYVIGDNKDRVNETDYMILFDKEITFKERKITLKNAKTIETYMENEIYHAIVNTSHVEVE